MTRHDLLPLNEGDHKFTCELFCVDSASPGDFCIIIVCFANVLYCWSFCYLCFTVYRIRIVVILTQNKLIKTKLLLCVISIMKRLLFSSLGIEFFHVLHKYFLQPKDLSLPLPKVIPLISRLTSMAYTPFHSVIQPSIDGFLSNFVQMFLITESQGWPWRWHKVIHFLQAWLRFCILLHKKRHYVAIHWT